jgi:hypothetical protein
VDIPACTTCGEPHLYTGTDGSLHPSCTGHGSGISHPERKGMPCRRLPTTGLTVCTVHGGRAPQTRRKAAQRMAEQAAEQLVRTFGTPVANADPGVIILERISVLAGHVRWLQTRVENLQEEEVVWGTTIIKTGGQDEGSTEAAAPNVWVTLYDRWSGQLTRLCIDALKVGLKEREVRIAEQQGAAICTLLDGLLTELGHNPDDPQTAAVVARHLQLVA